MRDVLKGLDLAPSDEEFKNLKEQEKEVKKIIQDKLKANKVKADVFTGGSFAKGTLLRGEEYDIDIFVRFDKKHENPSEILNKIVNRLKGYKITKVHGSRDYIRLNKESKITFEIIPVIKISKPKDAENVTDLSYFHVSYVKSALKKNKRLVREILLTKAFCKAQKAYGAEGYVRGLSGYGVECIILHYKSFSKFIKEISKARDKIFIDSRKAYKNKGEAFIELNESKTSGPIVLVDPTWKERNVLAALSYETFARLQNATLGFSKSPGKRWFMPEKTKDYLTKVKKENKAEGVRVRITTDKQTGDIAGTKMKKFSLFAESELSTYFDVIASEYEYSGENYADFYVVAKKKNEVIRKGPLLILKDRIKDFKRVHAVTFIKEDNVWARIKNNYSLIGFLEQWKNKNKNKTKEMSIDSIELNDL